MHILFKNFSLGCIVILLVYCGKVPTEVPNQPFEHFTEDFESGTVSGLHLLVPNVLANLQVVNQPIRKGNFALKNTLRPDDYINNGYRVELAVYNCAKYKTEVFYGFSFMIDTAYRDYEYNLVCQWQDLPNYLQGEDWNSSPALKGSPPPVALVYVNGQLELKMNTNPLSSQATFTVGNAKVIQKGIWYDMVFHIFWSEDADAYVEAWVNGVPFTPANGAGFKYYKPNLYNRNGNYFKFGQYRGKDKSSHSNSIYFDEVKIGSSYNEVSP